MNFSSAKMLRLAKTAAPFALAALIALVVAWMVFRKERYDSGCNNDYPTKGGLPETQGKCCKAKWSRKCQDTGTCPADYPFVGGRSDGSNTGKCCKGRHSNKCVGGSSSPSSSPSSSGSCPEFQEKDGSGVCRCRSDTTWNQAKGVCECGPDTQFNPSTRRCDPVVEVYSDTGKSGSKSLYPVGDYSSLYIGPVGNDSMSSIRIPTGLKVTLYQHTNYGGEQLTLDANLGSSDHNLTYFAFPSGRYNGENTCRGASTGCWNDTASSMKVYRA